jgi:hypothetical protein
MRNGAIRRQGMKTLLLALSGVLCATICASAGQEQYDISLQELRNPSYDIDLRELRRNPARRANAVRKIRKHRAPRRATTPPPKAQTPPPIAPPAPRVEPQPQASPAAPKGH